MAQVSMLEALQDWLLELNSVAGRSDTTLASHEAHIVDTVTTIAGHRDADPASLTFDDVRREDLVAALADYRSRPDGRFRERSDGELPLEAQRQRKATSMERRRRALSGFYKWAVKTGRAETNLPETFDGIKLPERHPKALADEEVAAVLEAARTSAWPQRDELIVLLPLTSGLRLEEVAGLRLGSLLGSPPDRVRVVGKGDKERIVPVLEPVRRTLDRYLPTRAAALAERELESDALLLSTRARKVGTTRTGHAVRSIDLTASGLSHIVKQLLRRAGVDESGRRVHALRHTYATTLLRGGANLRALQELLGHAHLDTVQIYTHVTDDDLQQAAARHALAHDDDS